MAMTYWLKLWGTRQNAYPGLPEDHLTFGKGGKPSVDMGDRLVILGVGTGGKLVAIVTATSGVTTPGNPDWPDWPYRCDSRIDLLCEDVDRAPYYGVLPDSENLKRWLRTTKGYRKITEEQFRVAEAAIRAAGGKPPAA